MLHHVAETENVRADNGRLTRHRFEQRDSERRLRRRARIDGAVRVVAGSRPEHRADKRDVGIAPGCAIVVIAQRAVANDHELRLAAAAADFLERFNQRGEAVARIESAEEENHRHVACG